MDVYKPRPGQGAYKSITRENFEADTRRTSPWYQEGADGREIHLAACPACDNPVQIVGLYRLPSNVARPYGRHMAHGVRGLAREDPEAREHCPFFKPRQLQKSARKRWLEGLPLKVLRLLVAQFDRVVFLVQRQTGITLSRRLLQEMLVKYRSEAGYLYTGATLMNVPWIFAYMADSHSLFNQHVAANGDLVRAIRAGIPAADISADGRVVPRVFSDGRKRYFELNVCFIHHRMSWDGDDGALTETMKMVVSTGENGSLKDIYRKTIAFDHQHFRNLVNLPADRARRRDDLIGLAREALGDLCGIARAVGGPMDGP